MGPFETTVDFYRFREPYPAVFFRKVADALALSRNTRLLDVACGPGNLAIGFAPFVGSCAAVDEEPGMLRAARQAAWEAEVAVTFIESAIQNFDAPENSYDFVTIGRAVHWLPPEPTLMVLERILAPEGQVAICGARAVESPANHWTTVYRQVLKEWSPGYDESRYRPDLGKWFANSRFRKSREIELRHTHWVAVADLISRALSFSSSSLAVIGDKRALFESAIRDALQPFASEGALNEEILVKATVFR